MVEMYKLTHKLYNFNPGIIILYSESNINRTVHVMGIDLLLTKCALTNKKHFLVNRIAKLWNCLPHNIVESENNVDTLWSNQEVLYE